MNIFLNGVKSYFETSRIRAFIFSINSNHVLNCIDAERSTRVWTTSPATSTTYVERTQGVSVMEHPYSDVAYVTPCWWGSGMRSYHSEDVSADYTSHLHVPRTPKYRVFPVHVTALHKNTCERSVINVYGRSSGAANTRGIWRTN